MEQRRAEKKVGRSSTKDSMETLERINDTFIGYLYVASVEDLVAINTLN